MRKFIRARGIRERPHSPYGVSQCLLALTSDRRRRMKGVLPFKDIYTPRSDLSLRVHQLTSFLFYFSRIRVIVVCELYSQVRCGLCGVLGRVGGRGQVWGGLSDIGQGGVDLWEVRLRLVRQCCSIRLFGSTQSRAITNNEIGQA
jgi:hypothetical protein